MGPDSEQSRSVCRDSLSCRSRVLEACMSGKATLAVDPARVPLISSAAGGASVTSTVAGMEGERVRSTPTTLLALSLPSSPRHNNQSHEKIRHSQREDKQVGGGVELLEVRDGDDHQQVQKHSEHRYT
ncbi:hypothetical protein MHYP_G00184010 [Metynnis hypsauchen]